MSVSYSDRDFFDCAIDLPDGLREIWQNAAYKGFRTGRTMAQL